MSIVAKVRGSMPLLAPGVASEGRWNDSTLSLRSTKLLIRFAALDQRLLT